MGDSNVQAYAEHARVLYATTTAAAAAVSSNRGNLSRRRT